MNKTQLKTIFDKHYCSLANDVSKKLKVIQDQDDQISNAPLNAWMNANY